MSLQTSLFPLFDAPLSPVVFRSVELFAGAGGLGMGLARAGFRHEVVVERDAAACNTLRHNKRKGFHLVRDWNIVEADVRSVDLTAIEGEVDLLSGGPPCTPWSIGGVNKGAADERDMWPWAVGATRTLAPRGFLFENVRNMAATHADYLDYAKYQLAFPELVRQDGETERDHHRRLAQYGATGRKDGLCYRVRHVLANAADYGAAQNRERVFIVGLRRDQTANWTPPAPTHSRSALDRDKWLTGAYWQRHGLAWATPSEAEMRRIRAHNRQPAADAHLKPHRTLRDAIADLGEPTDQGHPSISGHVRPPREARAYPGHTGSPIDMPAKALRAGDHGVSGGENMIDFGGRYRHYTVREAARLQDFDDGYDFPGTWSDGLKQLGNAVPVTMSHAHGLSMHAALAA